MRHERQIMLQELQNQEMDSFDYPSYKPNIPLKFVPIYNMPLMNTWILAIIIEIIIMIQWMN